MTSSHASLYSAYHPVEDDLLTYAAKIMPRRRFELAGGVWREVPRKRFRLRKLLLLVATAGLAYWTWSDRNVIPVEVKLSSAVTRDVPVYLDAGATVQANQTVTVHAQVDGQLSEIVFKEGQDVKAGDVLARLDPRNYQMQYDEAVVNKAQDEAMLVQTKNELARLKASLSARAHKHADVAQVNKMLEEKRSQLKQFEATIKSDQVTIDTLKTQLSRSVIVSPIDGRTGIRQVDTGNMVHASDPNGLVVITQVEPVSVVFTMQEKKLHTIRDRIARGEKIMALAMDSDDKNILDEGTLEVVDNQVDPADGTVHLKAIFPNHKRLLWPGGTVHVRLLISSMKDAVVVPAAAVHSMEGNPAIEARDGQKPWVYVYKPDRHTIGARTVRIAMVQDGDAIIEEGVHPGEQVVTDTMSPIKDGSLVVAHP